MPTQHFAQSTAMYHRFLDRAVNLAKAPVEGSDDVAATSIRDVLKAMATELNDDGGCHVDKVHEPHARYGHGESIGVFARPDRSTARCSGVRCAHQPEFCDKGAGGPRPSKASLPNAVGVGAKSPHPA